MALDPKYVVTSDLESYFVDKDSGLPLAYGVVTFYRDTNKSVKKPVYQITGTAPNYGYSPLINPIILSGAGTFQDESGNNIVPYYYPYDDNGNLDLYYITVYNSAGVLQFTRIGWPNEAQGNDTFTAQEINYIPNGQFVAHNDDRIATVTAINTPSSTNYEPIAQGGWFLAIPGVGAANVYANTFTQQSTPVSGLDDYPRYFFNFICTSNGGDAVRDLVIRWPGVNTFAANQNGQPPIEYSFFFQAKSNDGASHNFDVRQIYYFGSGSATVATNVSIGTSTVTTSFGDYQKFTVTFLPQTGAVGPNNDDFVGIALRAPDAGSFNVSFTDFGLVQGNDAITFYPIKTEAQMVSEATAGWLPSPVADNQNLYLPIIMGPSGFLYDYSVIGNIESSTNTSALNTSLKYPRLLCDGSSYVSYNNAVSNLGIPYNRLGNYLISNSSVTGVPMFGTGANYNNAYIMGGATSIIRLANNTAGAGTNASVGTVAGWTFTNTTVGAATINLFATTYSPSTVLMYGVGFTTAILALADGAGAQATGWGFTTLNNFTGITAQNVYAAQIDCGNAATVVNTGLAGKYFQFGNAATSFYVWFKFTNETDPAPGGVGIQVNVPSTAIDAPTMAGIVKEAINQFHISSVTVGAVPTAGQYWNFVTNPAAPRFFYCWYYVDGAGTDPAPGVGSPIKVSINSTDTTADVASKTMLEINKYQFQTPNLSGMFLRGTDPTSSVDINAASRWSTVSGISGAIVGTFEYQQILHHVHTITHQVINGAAGGTPYLANSPGAATTFTGNTTGGSETRPTNFSVNYYIRY